MEHKLLTIILALLLLIFIIYPLVGLLIIFLVNTVFNLNFSVNYWQAMGLTLLIQLIGATLQVPKFKTKI